VADDDFNLATAGVGTGDNSLDTTTGAALNTASAAQTSLPNSGYLTAPPAQPGDLPTDTPIVTDTGFFGLDLRGTSIGNDINSADPGLSQEIKNKLKANLPTIPNWIFIVGGVIAATVIVGGLAYITHEIREIA
jgi:hypothetical protein